MNSQRVAFVDESGAPSPAAGGRFLAVAVLVVESSRDIDLHVRRARRSLHRKVPASELKAAQTDEKVIRRLLTFIANEPCAIYGLILDKRGLTTKSAEPGYQRAVAEAIALAVAQYPELRVTIDRRYTRPRQREQLELAIRRAIAAISQQIVIIEQADSMAHPGLQAADFVAWALRRQAEGANEWSAILRERVVELKTIVAAEAQKNSGSAWRPITTAQ